jgi:hypothetical protein
MGHWSLYRIRGVAKKNPRIIFGSLPCVDPCARNESQNAMGDQVALRCIINAAASQILLCFRRHCQLLRCQLLRSRNHDSLQCAPILL